MKKKIGIVVLAAAIGGVTACTSTPVGQQNAAPVTTTSVDVPAPTTVVVTEFVTSTATIPPKVVTDPPKAATRIDNRIGYGPLKMGMTLAEVEATGLVGTTLVEADSARCWVSSQVLVSKNFGLVRITLPAEARTSAGIGVGSTFADVKRAYPAAKEYRDGFSAPVDEKVSYAFVGPASVEHFADSDKVLSIKLSSRDADCSMALI
ncbi:hypothetical protein [Lentzea sp. NPDC059081]|uniref:hypothetical protein n=1 Tax=Lentzea sp. NPDC059081 TaxID=3346719 RepID=UPI0036C5348F